jgi:Ni/Co efflux regulator RcnB
MNKSILAIATSALLLGCIGVAHAQSAYQVPYDANARYGYESGDPRYDARSDPRYDDRYDERGEYRNDERDPRYYDRYGNREDGRYDGRRGDVNRHDRDCDGISDRYDRDDRHSVNDRDCDGVDNRFEHRNGRHNNARVSFAGPRYQTPSGYRYARYDYGSRLPRNYWGNQYYVDYRQYGLSQPPPGYAWNRVGNDVYMIGMHDGLVAEAIYSLFR